MSGPDLWDLANDFAEAAERYLADELSVNGMHAVTQAAYDAGLIGSADVTDVSLACHPGPFVKPGVLLDAVARQALRRARERCS